MDIKTIKSHIKEILTLTEGQDYLVEGARNFSYTDSPTLDFYPSYDEDGDYYEEDDYYPQFSRDYKPNYVNSEDYYFPSSLNTDFACIAVEIGYYEGVRFYIEKQDDIEGLVYELTEASEDDEDGETLYSYISQRQSDSVHDLRYAEMYVYMQNLVTKEYKKGIEVLVSMHNEYGGKLSGVSKEFLAEPESSGEEFDESYLGESTLQSKYRKGQKFIHNRHGDEWEITGIEFQPNGGFYYNITNRNGRTPFSNTINLTLFVPEKNLDTEYTDVTELSEPESTGEEFNESYNPDENDIPGYNEEAPINYILEIYDIVWENDYNESILDTNIKEYCWLDDNMLRQLYDSHANIKKFLTNESQYIAKDILDRFEETEAIQYFVNIQDIDEVVNKIENYFEEHFEEPKEPEDDGSDWDEELQEQLNHILKLAKL